MKTDRLSSGALLSLAQEAGSIRLGVGADRVPAGLCDRTCCSGTPDHGPLAAQIEMNTALVSQAAASARRHWQDQTWMIEDRLTAIDATGATKAGNRSPQAYSNCSNTPHSALVDIVGLGTFDSLLCTFEADCRHWRGRRGVEGRRLCSGG